MTDISDDSGALHAAADRIRKDGLVLNAEARDRLVKLLALLGSRDADRRARAAPLISQFADSLGGWDTLLKSPRGNRTAAASGGVSAPRPDTPWRQSRLKDGRAGSQRRYNGTTLTVRQCQPVRGVAPDPSRPSEVRWYATIDGGVLSYADGQPQIFRTEYEAQNMAECAAGPELDTLSDTEEY